MKPILKYTMLRHIIAAMLLIVTSWAKEATGLGALEANQATIFSENRASVVYISTSRTVIDYRRLRADRIPRGTGTGFIWDTQGHIVTNYHVIAGCDSATVKLSNGQTYPAKLVGYDKGHDLAVLQIDPPRHTLLRAITKGDSSRLQVGQMVYAIGNPYGLDWTMTSGIISALERNLYHIPHAKIRHAIQTDAAINPGNSGGPLLDGHGRVIGVNTALFSPSGTFAGIGFATPINIAKRVVGQIIRHGYYRPPQLGIYSDDRINRYIKERYGIEGVAILDLIPGSDLARYDIRRAILYSDGQLTLGDMITHVNGMRIKDLETLASALERHRSGDQVTLTLVDNRRKRHLRVTLR